MENQPEVTKPSSTPNYKDLKSYILIEIGNDDRIRFESFNFKKAEGADVSVRVPMTIREKRSLLRDTLDFVNDQTMAEFCSIYIDNLMKQQIQPNGFRKKSMFDFLKGK